MYQRNIIRKLNAALADTRVVLLNGARQVGKSTLAQQLAQQRGGQYLTLDDPVVAELARTDPSALVDGTAGLTVLDEVQAAPGLFPALEREVDRRPEPGRFLLIGSANVFVLPTAAESLAGRMEVLALEPLSQGEIEGSPHNLVDALFDRAPWARRSVPTERLDLVRRLVAGGFPETLGRSDPQRRDAWFRAYLASLLQRDVRDYANIEGLHDMPRLLSLLAARASALLNMAEVSRATGIAHSTLRRYLSLLQALFIVQPLPAWSANLGKRLVKAPKMHLIDAGLTAHLRGESDAAALALSPQLGPLLETFVVQEVRRHLRWADAAATAWHFRTAAGQEVDLVLETPDRRIAGVEVKASASITQGDFSGLRELANAAGKGFAKGIVLYTGEQLMPFEETLWAVPLGALWAGGTHAN
ncbi:MAG TPA: ATP-binding protein [Rubrivivax sp.]|nr:ATP-binding protein [Rubrivivax sp.]HPO20298.1 ATP-binding protein [Rubrivivax sp.]